MILYYQDMKRVQFLARYQKKANNQKEDLEEEKLKTTRYQKKLNIDKQRLLKTILIVWSKMIAIYSKF